VDSVASETKHAAGSVNAAGLARRKKGCPLWGCQYRRGFFLIRQAVCFPELVRREDSVVSVQELKMSSKTESAFERGTKFLQKGDARSSLVYFEKAVARDPGYYRAYHNLGLAQYLLGEKAQAEEALQRAIDLTNGGYAPSQFALAMILLEKQQCGKAEAVIQRGLTMEPGSAQGEYLLGLVQFATERFADAERSARDALLRSANQAEVYILLAEIHARRHEPYSVKADVAAYLRLDGHGPLADEADLLLKRAQMEIRKGPGELR
jgi:tetratricopeptide (TPR) repeat protein